jgi:hypothetical protein
VNLNNDPSGPLHSRTLGSLFEPLVLILKKVVNQGGCRPDGGTPVCAFFTPVLS